MGAALAYAVEGYSLIRPFYIECCIYTMLEQLSIVAILSEHVTLPSLDRRGKCKRYGSRKAQVKVVIQDSNLMFIDLASSHLTSLRSSRIACSTS